VTSAAKGCGQLFKLCQRCEVAEVSSPRHRVCHACAIARIKQIDRERQVARRLPCPDCGGPKDGGRGAKICSACRERRRPMWQQAETRRARARSETRARANPQRQKKWDAPEGTKWCNRCQEYRPQGDFAPNPSKSAGLAPYCRPCTSDYAFERRLIRVYGITMEQYLATLEEQGGRCAICQKKPRARRLAVDHNHKTGRVRGLLCTRCNHKLLGASGENPQILRRAAEYLEHYAEAA